MVSIDKLRDVVMELQSKHGDDTDLAIKMKDWPLAVKDMALDMITVQPKSEYLVEDGELSASELE